MRVSRFQARDDLSLWVQVFEKFAAFCIPFSLFHPDTEDYQRKGSENQR